MKQGLCGARSHGRPSNGAHTTSGSTSVACAKRACVPWDPEAGLSPAATAPECGSPGTRPRLRPGVLSIQCSPAPLRRPRCGAASQPRAFSRLRRGSFFPGSRSLGEGALGGVERERPPGEPGALTPHSLPAAEDGENRPWLMMMI